MLKIVLGLRAIIKIEEEDSEYRSVMYTWEINQWESRTAGTKILMQLSEQFLELVSVFIEASIKFVLIFLFKAA